MLDLLDRQIIDDEQQSVGKVDDVDFVADGPGPPRLSALLSGAQALGERMGGLVRRTMAGAARRMLIDPRAGARAVPWSDVAELGYVIELRAGIAELHLDPPSKCGCATTSSAPCPAAVMRAAELLGRPVRHREGTDLGRVLDIRITRTPGTPEPGAWNIDGIVVGHRWAFARAGYAYGNVDGPLPLALVLRVLGRHLRFARWDQLDIPATNAALTLRPALAELPHPKKV